MVKRKSILIVLLLLSFFAAATGATTRKPVVAGGFYPAEPAALRQLVAQHLDNVKDSPVIEGKIVALIVPHAGLVYSGQIAAHSYKLLEGSGFDKVILCGPSHRYPFRGISVYGPEVTWQTPLGNITCADQLCRSLISFDPRIKVIPEAHRQEHCLEVQLPYLQMVLDDFEIVPAVMGYQDRPANKLLAQALAALPWDDKTLLIASTDWQHFHPAASGWKMDSLAIACVKDLDIDRLENLLLAGKVEMCGGGPTVAVLRAAMARGADRVKILKYGDSGDVSGDKSSVVGYVAAVIYKSEATNAKPPAAGAIPAPEIDDSLSRFELTESDRRQLLKIARKSIAGYLADGAIPHFDVPANLRVAGAAFVTLKKEGHLRGCIGYTEAIKPLYETVSSCAVSAAAADRRFKPVQAAELDSLHIEISVLTPLQRVKSFSEIEVGRDGLMITKGSRRGLLLPQVAADYGWNTEQFLQQTCRKAGLPLDAYKSADAVVYKFQAVIFGE